MADIKPYLQKFVEKFDNPDVQAALKGYTKTLQFDFTDTGEKWLIRVEDGTKATLTAESLEKSDMTIKTTTEVMAGIIEKKINPQNAYMQRKITIKGSMDDLFRLQKLLL
jgi:putative sterol carrier protein